MSYISDQYAGMASDMAQAMRDREARNHATINDNAFWNLNETCLEVIDDKAHVLAQRAALANYIRTLFQDKNAYIPAMDDKSIWESIGAAGISAWHDKEDWEAVKEAGRTFRLPEGPDIYKDHVPRAIFLKQNDGYMKSIAHGIESEFVVRQLSLKNAKYEKHIKEIDAEKAFLLQKLKKDELSIQQLMEQVSILKKQLTQET